MNEIRLDTERCTDLHATCGRIVIPQEFRFTKGCPSSVFNQTLSERVKQWNSENYTLVALVFIMGETSSVCCGGENVLADTVACNSDPHTGRFNCGRIYLCYSPDHPIYEGVKKMETVMLHELFHIISVHLDGSLDKNICGSKD